MTKPIVISILANASQAQATLTQTATTADKIGAGFKRAAVPAAALLTGMTAGAKSLIDTASDAEQSIGATRTVFKEYADEVIERSKQAAEAVGLSANEYRELANVTGAMLKNAGTPLKEVAGLTDDLTGRAADLAATYGGTTKDAIEAVGSLLRGEADPIERYGVSIKQSDVNARLAAQGLDKLTGSAKKQAEQQARLELLFEQTADAAGQFDRESDTVANKAQKNAAKMADLSAELGEQLLPAYIEVQEYASKFLKFLARNPDAVRKTAIAVAGLAAAVLAVNLAMKVYTAASTVVTAVTKTYEKATESATRKTIAMRGAAATAGVALVGLSQSGQIGEGALSKVATVAGATIAGGAMGGIPGAAIGAGSALLTLAGQSEESAERQKAFLAIQEQINAQAETLKTTLDEQTGAITANTEAAAAKALADNGAFTAAQKLGLSFDLVTRAALGDEAAKRQVTAATEDYIISQGKAGNGALDMADKLAAAKTEMEPLSGSVNRFSAELDEAQTATRQTNRAISQMAERARDEAASMRRAGSDAGRGYRDGLASWIDRVYELGRSMVRAAVNGVRTQQQSSSPSRVTRGLGRDFGQGYALGIDGEAERAAQAARETVAKAVRAVKQTNTGFSFAPPVNRASFSMAATSATQPVAVTIKVEATPTTDLRRTGREIAEALNEYLGAGGRVAW